MHSACASHFHITIIPSPYTAILHSTWRCFGEDIRPQRGRVPKPNLDRSRLFSAPSLHPSSQASHCNSAKEGTILTSEA